MNKKNVICVSFILLLFVALAGCKDSPKDPDAPKKKRGPISWVRNIIGNFSSQDTIFLDSTAVDQFLAKYPAFNAYHKDIKKFYTDRKFAYAWYDGKGIIEQSGYLYNRLENMEFDGVEDSLLYRKQLDELMNRPNRKNNREELEVMLTSQYFALANYVWKGLSEEEIKKLGWFIPRKKLSTSSFLDSMLTTSDDNFLEDEPVNQQYETLKAQLKRYKDLEEKVSWSPIIADKKKFEPGDTSGVVKQIRTRLTQLGDLPEDNQQSLYDGSLVNAVKAFQQRHGLASDGIIGQAMIDELNVPVNKRVEQIIVNMERTRWMPIDYASNQNFLIVNIPEYKLHVYEGNKPVWNCNVVVGETENKTVIFNGVLKYIVFSPHWNIPESIIRDEILPSIEKDPDYLVKQELEITGERNGLPVIRQKPGQENSLGLVKFMFPNTHNIYLHDSPAKELFKRTDRAFSHGCVRVSEPVKLADYLLRDDPTWNDATIKDAMMSGEEKYVNLKTKMPVYIVYFTSWVDGSGKLNFRKDIYDNDARLARMILENTSKGSVARSN